MQQASQWTSISVCFTGMSMSVLHPGTVAKAASYVACAEDSELEPARVSHQSLATR